MTLMLRNLSIFALAVAYTTGLCFGQARSGPGKNHNTKSDALSLEEQYFLAAARRLATESAMLESEGQRALLLIKLSGVIWNHDEVLSRDLLLRSFDLIATVYNEQVKTPRSEVQEYDPNLLFQEVISVAAEHDLSLARELERRRGAILETASRASRDRPADSIKLSQLLISEAAGVLATDEQRARTLLRQSAFLYTTQNHFSFLSNLRHHSNDLADRLFADVLEALSQRPLREANEILILASYLFSPTETVNYSLVSGYNAANVSGDLSGLPRNATLAKEYLLLLLRSLDVSDTSPATVVYLTLTNLLGQFRALAPEAMNDVYAKIGKVRAQIGDKDLETANNSREVSKNEGLSWTERLKRAEEVPNSDLRDLEYFTIIDGYLLPQKDFSNADAVADRVNNNELRQKLRDYIYFRAIQNKENLPVLSRFVESTYERIHDPLVKALAECEEAYFFHKHNENNEAGLLLEEAIRQSERISSGQDRLQVKMTVTNAYLDFNASRAFQIAKEAFREVGKVNDFKIRKADFTLQIVVYGLRNELSLGTSADSSLVSSVKKMCRADCMEALNIAQILPQRSQRLQASLVAIDSFFSDKKNIDK